MGRIDAYHMVNSVWVGGWVGRGGKAECCGKVNGVRKCNGVRKGWRKEGQRRCNGIHYKGKLVFIPFLWLCVLHHRHWWQQIHHRYLSHQNQPCAGWRWQWLSGSQLHRTLCTSCLYVRYTGDVVLVPSVPLHPSVNPLHQIVPICAHGTRSRIACTKY